MFKHKCTFEFDFQVAEQLHLFLAHYGAQQIQKVTFSSLPQAHLGLSTASAMDKPHDQRLRSRFYCRHAALLETHGPTSNRNKHWTC